MTCLTQCPCFLKTMNSPYFECQVTLSAIADHGTIYLRMHYGHHSVHFLGQPQIDLICKSFHRHNESILPSESSNSSS